MKEGIVFIIPFTIGPKLAQSIFLSIVLILSITHIDIANANTLSDKNAIQKLLIDEANRQYVDPTLALAIAEVESNFNTYALSSAGAVGVMQIMPATAKNVFGIAPEQLYDAKINIHLGISFIKRLLARYKQRLDIALSHYNGGSSVQDKFGKLSVIPATKSYIEKVLSAQEKYRYRTYVLSSDSPKKTYTKTAVELSLYKKVEELRTLRLHNIMRNTKQKSAKTIEDKIIANPSRKNRNKLFINNSVLQSKKEATLPLSPKRKKILSWEKIYN